MARIWFVKTGGRPANGSPWKEVAALECVAKLQIDQLCRTEDCPRFGERQGLFPTHVVVQIDEGEEELAGLDAGFYLSPLRMSEVKTLFPEL